MTLPAAGPAYISNTYYATRCWWTDSHNWRGTTSDDPGRCRVAVPDDPDHIGLCDKHLSQLREATCSDSVEGEVNP